MLISSFPHSLGKAQNGIQITLVREFLRACGEHEWAEIVNRKWDGVLNTQKYYRLQDELACLMNDVLNE